jgi:hypothetical protein
MAEMIIANVSRRKVAKVVKKLCGTAPLYKWHLKSVKILIILLKNSAIDHWRNTYLFYFC